MPTPRIGHRHVFFEPETGHRWCHMCGQHAPDNKVKCDSERHGTYWLHQRDEREDRND